MRKRIKEKKRREGEIQRAITSALSTKSLLDERGEINNLKER